MELGTKQVADILGIPTATLHARRRSGSGGGVPKHKRKTLPDGRSAIMFDARDVETFIMARLRDQESEAKESLRKLIAVKGGA